MKWKLFRRKMGVSAPRVTVRAQLPFALRALLFFFVTAIAAAAGIAIYEYGKQFAGPDRRELLAQIDKLQSQLRETKAERDRFQAVATAYESQMKVEHAAQEQLARQVTALEAETAKLREDLSFFESLLPTPANAKGVLIRSFRVQADGEPNRMRYRLLVQQSGKPERDFNGAVELQVNFMHNGRPFTLHIPDPAANASRAVIELSFRHYQRVEGTFMLPPGAIARSVLVRILANNGQPQTQQSFPVS
jgi:cell division protein FtsL